MINTNKYANNLIESMYYLAWLYKTFVRKSFLYNHIMKKS